MLRVKVHLATKGTEQVEKYGWKLFPSLGFSFNRLVILEVPNYETEVLRYRSSRFLFCPEDAIEVLLVVIPRPVGRLTLLLDLPRRLLVVLKFARLYSVLLSTQEALLESFRGTLNLACS